MATQINVATLRAIAVNAMRVPPEGPVAIPVDLDFTTNSEFEIDLQNFIALNRVSMIQGVYINNSEGAAVVIIEISSTKLRIPCTTAGYVFAPLPTSNPCTIRIFSPGDPNGLVKVIFFNYPVEPSQLFAGT